MTCETCAHLDTEEACVLDRIYVSPGACTKADNWFNGEHVPVWLSGCPDYEPIASPQGDGDPGSEAA